MEGNAGLHERFQAAVDASRQLPRRPDNHAMLKMYALFKQATVGDVNGDPPSAFDFVGRAKYDAWSGVKGLAADDARQQYIDLIERLRQ